MISSADLLAQATELAAPDADGDDRDFCLAVSDIYRTLAQLAAKPEVARVLEPAL
jgi:hypothetical protein